jgi:class III cytochrome C family protein
MLKMAMLILAGILIVGISGLYAGTEVKDVINMENKAYEKHKKSIAVFTHKKHVEEYGAGCGECHHDEKGKPLNDLKMGDDVQNCIECHSKPGQKPKKSKLTPKEELQYHAEAIHDNCRGCHKDFNKKNKPKKKAPTSCNGCHPKKKK